VFAAKSASDLTPSHPMKSTFRTGSMPTGQVVFISFLGLNLSTHPGKNKEQKRSNTKIRFGNMGQFSSNVEKKRGHLSIVGTTFSS
jgi:hypothetical protein